MVSLDFERECGAYCDHLNEMLAEYQAELSEYLPLQPSNLLARFRDGVLLTYILHYFYPEALKLESAVRGIDMDRAGPEGNQTAVFEATANLNRALGVARQVKNLVVVNIGAQDVLEMKADLVLGLVWQLIRSRLLDRVNLISHPELIRLLQPGESLAVLAALRPEPLLLRWVNYHMERSGASCRVHSLGRDVCDGEAYLRLITAIAPASEEKSFDLEAALLHPHKPRLALEWAAQLLNIPIDSGVLRVADIESGHPRLNLAFTATLFNGHVGIHLPSEDELRTLYGEIAGLQKTVFELEDQLVQARSRRTESMEDLRLENDSLREQMETHRAEQEANLQSIEAEFEGFKEELAAQYQESLDSALASERRVHQQELGEARATAKEARRRVLVQLGDLQAMVGPAELQDSKVGLMLRNISSEEAPLEQLVQLQGGLVHMLGEKIRRLTQANEDLQGELEHKAHLESVMAAKIREYSEQRINEASARERRTPALVSFRTNLRKVFTCQHR